MRVVTVPRGTVILVLGDDLTEEQVTVLGSATAAQRNRLEPAWLAILVGVLLVILGLVVVPLLRLWVGPGDALNNIALFLVGAGAVLIGAGTGTRRS